MKSGIGWIWKKEAFKVVRGGGKIAIFKKIFGLLKVYFEVNFPHNEVINDYFM